MAKYSGKPYLYLIVQKIQCQETMGYWSRRWHSALLHSEPANIISYNENHLRGQKVRMSYIQAALEIQKGKIKHLINEQKEIRNEIRSRNNVSSNTNSKPCAEYPIYGGTSGFQL